MPEIIVCTRVPNFIWIACEDYPFEICVYEDEENPEHYFVSVEAKWDCEMDLYYDYGPGSYSEESLTIEECNEWIGGFWEREAKKIIDACAEYGTKEIKDD
ncbi:MAG: hypothetical protein VSS75_014095 [Candidatus Parabeggiatoa sp.]|nr:hypothetical protein [Candidatus Parabeggiatoa sp.]